MTFDRTVTFVTGTARRDPAPPEVRLSLFGVPIGAESGAPAGTLLEVYVETDAVEPLFVVAEGEQDVLVHDLNPFSADRPFRVGFGSVECAALTVVDATGTTLADPVLCEPSKCARVESVAASICGEEVFPASMDWSAWQSLPEGCDREALLQGPAAVAMLGSGDGATPTTSPGEASTPQAQAVGGCGLSARSSGGQIFAIPGLLLAALVGARSRRRST